MRAKYFRAVASQSPSHKILVSERQEKVSEENESVLLDMKVNILEIYEVRNPSKMHCILH